LERLEGVIVDDFKKENVKDYTSWDLNCRKVLPHDKKKNNLEKKIRRKTRRKMKKDLKKLLTNE
jgi:hypothetical protein